ncbi:hypothetical protein TWF106_005178 [Orbilia oligospora]|uniref:Uncharacterized protein n=1 Tax=Orbilia oligospora TaxID=2813651 RepID=A0A6G1MH47_ORBOL|nr:hypothetical protein TWF788_004695 [Orbilia oligospora]KAF3196242.1 hypothetical protein TWF106_005178 [Orbilia oligospora]KAF3201157.1 hypothetical protein TWF191_003474 [Orbilia oligospora]KAF3258863.1 hypothetical protein TWF192_011001 [Orbilia oligospora]
MVLESAIAIHIPHKVVIFKLVVFAKSACLTYYPEALLRAVFRVGNTFPGHIAGKHVPVNEVDFSKESETIDLGEFMNLRSKLKFSIPMGSAPSSKFILASLGNPIPHNSPHGSPESPTNTLISRHLDLQAQQYKNEAGFPQGLSVTKPKGRDLA